MLEIRAIPNTAAAKKYFSASNRDYYAEGQDIPATWRGKAAELLGLSGQVEMEQFFALCDNLHPATGTQLTARTIENRRVGYDFTFSPSKSVSIAWTIGGDQRIVTAFQESVAETMAELEHAMEARVRKRGAFENRRVGNMVWCDWLHPESRPINGQPDPQMHIHAVVLNAVYDPVEKQWKAGDFAEIKRHARYYQAAFHARLANKLQELGYGIRRTKDAFEIEGIPQSAISQFSRRTKQIEALADKLKVVDPKSKAKLGATSREAKAKGLTWDDLQRLWRERLSERELAAIEAVRANATQPVQVEPQHAAAMDYALAHVLERKSVAGEREVAREALKFGLGRGVTPEGVWKEMGREGIIRRDGMVSTQVVLSEEKRIVAFAVKGRGACRPLGGGIPVHDAGDLRSHPRKADIATNIDLVQAESKRDASRPVVGGTRSSLSPAARSQPMEGSTAGRGRELPADAQGIGERLLASPLPPDASSGTAPRPENGILSRSTQADSVSRGPVATPAADGYRRSEWVLAEAARPLIPSKSQAFFPRAALHAAATPPDIATLSPSQQAAIRHVWSSPDRIMVIEGKAGVGKTTLLKPLLSGINVPWLAVATSSDASRINLREDPFFAEADTLSAFFKSEEMQERVRGGLLVLDEASMTSAPDFAKLTKLADQLNFRILAVGDPGQHKSVGRGHIMDLLTKKANLPVALVDDIQRQKRAERKEYLTAAELLSKGRTADAFAVLDGIGWVKDANLATLADDYLAVQKSGKRPIVICPTHAERKHVEAALRERLRKEGLLKGIEQEVSSLTNLHMTEAELAEARKEKPEGVVFGRFGAYHPEAMKLAVGDRVRITAGGKDMGGGRLDNGMVFTVTGFTKTGDVRVRNDDSRLERTIRRDYGHWRLGYVETSPGSQGKTRDVPLVWEPVSTFPAITSAAAYVPVTRGTQKVFVYTDDKAGLQEVWQREETHLHASDLVKRPRHKLRQRLKRHISFLRDVASRATDRLLTLATPTQENHREISR